MGRIYSIEGGPTAETVKVDFFSIVPADDKPCILHAVFIGQTTEVGDAQEEQLEVLIVRGGTGMTVGSGGAAPTPRPIASSADAASGFTARTLDTTVATFTAGVNVHRDTFNVRNGWQYYPAPEDRIGFSQANGGLAVSMTGAPADSITFTVTAIIEELG